MTDDSAPNSMSSLWRRETAVIAGALFVGLIVLPVVIWSVGQALIGPYEGGDGAFALAEKLWLDALALEPAAWLLLLSPYALVQLGRLFWRACRGSAS
jgi:hypothetical protein